MCSFARGPSVFCGALLWMESSQRVMSAGMKGSKVHVLG